MQTRKISSIVVFLIAGFGQMCLAQKPPDPATLLKQLKVPETTDQAAEQLSNLGKVSARTRRYLARHLPAMIENDTNNYVPWANAVRLAGELKLVEAVPALARWISARPGGTVSLGGEERLEYNPAAKALAQIGDPAVPTLLGVLEHGNLKERQVAVKALKLIASPAAKNALQRHVDQEADSDLRSSIQEILAK